MRRSAAIVGGALLAAIVALFCIVVWLALLSPFTSVQLPDACVNAGTNVPAGPSAQVPGVGAGTLLADDADTSVAVVAPGGVVRPGATVYIVDRRADRVVQRIGLASNAVVAAINDGTVFMFDDGIGYIFRASSGEPVPKLIESDNYRGLYTSGGTRYLQTDTLITALGFDGRPFFQRTVHFAGVAYGCFVPAGAG